MTVVREIIDEPSEKKLYEPSRKISSFRIRGFQHWDGALVINDMKVGESVTLRPETDNPYDPNAIAIYFNDTKLGYIPSEENSFFATLFFYGHSDIFETRILQVNPEADPWDQVRVGVYITDIRE